MHSVVHLPLTQFCQRQAKSSLICGFIFLPFLKQKNLQRLVTITTVNIRVEKRWRGLTYALNPRFTV